MANERASRLTRTAPSRVRRAGSATKAAVVYAPVIRLLGAAQAAYRARDEDARPAVRDGRAPARAAAGLSVAKRPCIKFKLKVILNAEIATNAAGAARPVFVEALPERATRGVRIQHG